MCFGVVGTSTRLSRRPSVDLGEGHWAHVAEFDDRDREDPLLLTPYEREALTRRLGSYRLSQSATHHRRWVRDMARTKPVQNWPRDRCCSTMTTASSALASFSNERTNERTNDSRVAQVKAGADSPPVATTVAGIGPTFESNSRSPGRWRWSSSLAELTGVLASGFALGVRDPGPDLATGRG
jgi:hypothetical protein